MTKRRKIIKKTEQMACGRPKSICGGLFLVSGRVKSVSGRLIFFSGRPKSICGGLFLVSGRFKMINGGEIIISGQEKSIGENFLELLKQ